jgi:hypothetical protein
MKAYRCDALITGLYHTAQNASFWFEESNIWFANASLRFDRTEMVFIGSSNFTETPHDMSLTTDARLISGRMELIDSHLILNRNGSFSLFGSSELRSNNTNITIVGRDSNFEVADSRWRCGSVSGPTCGDMVLADFGHAVIRRSVVDLQGFEANLLSGSDFRIIGSSAVINGSIYVLEAAYFLIRDSTVGIDKVRFPHRLTSSAFLTPLYCATTGFDHRAQR